MTDLLLQGMYTLLVQLEWAGGLVEQPGAPTCGDVIVRDYCLACGTIKNDSSCTACGGGKDGAGHSPDCIVNRLLRAYEARMEDGKAKEHVEMEDDTLLLEVLEVEHLELQAECTALRAQLSEVDRLCAELNAELHPDGDGPTLPPLCDLVTFVKADRADLRTELAHYKAENKVIKTFIQGLCGVQEPPKDFGDVIDMLGPRWSALRARAEKAEAELGALWDWKMRLEEFSRGPCNINELYYAVNTVPGEGMTRPQPGGGA